MYVITIQPLSLSSWHTILVGLAVELACEAAALLFVSTLADRRWHERALVALPLAAFVWVLGVARGIQLQLDYWSSYFAFLSAHYPPNKYPLLYEQTQHDYRLAIAATTDSANHLGWTAVLLTEGMVLLGGVLLLYWYTQARRGIPAKPPSPAPPKDDGEDGALEITIEPLSLPYNG